MSEWRGEEGAAVFSWDWLMWIGAWLGLGLLLADYHYALFHGLVELLCISLTGSVFVLAWNGRRYAGGDYLALLGVSCLGVGGFDALQLLAYNPQSDLGLALQLDGLRDLTAGLTLLIAALWGHPRLCSPLLPALYGLLLLGLLALVHFGLSPVHPGPGGDWAEERIAGEVCSSLVLLAAGGVCWRRRRSLDRQVWPFLLAAIFAGLVAEQLAILGVLWQDLAVVGGHLAWTVSFYLVYRALVRVGIANPHAVALRGLQVQQEELAEEKEELEQRLAEQQQLNQLAIEQAADAVFWANPDGHIVDVNEAACRMLGYTRPQLLALAVTELDVDCDPEGWRAHWQDLKRQGSVLLTTRHRARDGRILNVEITANHIELDGREFSCGFVRDITTRLQAEAALLAAERRFRDLLDNVRLAGVLFDLEGRILYCNEYLLSLLGCARQQVLGQDWFELGVPLAQRAEVRRVFAEIVFEGDPEIYRHYEHEVEGAGGHRRLVAWNNTLLRDEQGEVYAVASLGADITGQRQAEMERHQSEALLRSLVDNSPAVIFLKDRDGRYVLGNPPFFRVLGRSREEVLGRTAWEVFPKEIAQPLHEHDQQVLHGGQVFHGQEVVLSGGQERTFLAVKFPATSPQGQVLGLGGISTDITEVKQAEIALRQSEAKYRIVADNTYDWEFWLSPEGRFRYCSPSCERLTGYTAAEFAADPGLLASIVHPEDREAFSLHHSAQRETGGMEFRLVARDGQVRWINHVCQPVYDGEGEYLGMRGSNRDVTARRQAEEALLQSARLISLGEMAAGIAHELNQPLTVVATLAEGLQIRLEQGMVVPPERQLQWSEEVLAQVERMRRIIDHLRDFSRKRFELPSEVVNLNEVVGSALGLSQAQLKARGIELRQDLAAALPPVLGDPYRLEQVLLNLIGNARDALDQREKELGAHPPPRWEKAMWVRTRLVEARHAQAEVTIYESAGLRSAEVQAEQGWVVVEVEDFGLGISEENQHRLFQPFFTTKEPGAGTGLGLSISYTIVRDHRGRLEYRSRLGEGSVFQVWLPVPS